MQMHRVHKGSEGMVSGTTTAPKSSGANPSKSMFLVDSQKGTSKLSRRARSDILST